MNSTSHVSSPPTSSTALSAASMPLRSSMPAPTDLSRIVRKEWLAEFESAWTMTDALFDGLLNDAAFYIRPSHGLRHPLVFYFVHPAVFYVSKLRAAGFWPEARDEDERAFEESFAIGVDEHSWDDVDRPQNSWPKLEDLREYRNFVREGIQNFITEHHAFESAESVDEDHPLWSLAMGIEHERIHIETTSVLMRELPIECVRPTSRFPAIFPSEKNRRPTPNAWITIPGRSITFGKNEDFTTYHWDNERGRKRANVATFEVQRQLVSNAAFAEFVEDEGYQDDIDWTEDGCKWREFRKREHPIFWVKTPSGDYRLRTIFEEIEMPWDWPVIVNYHEAKAYSQWLSRKTGDESIRLPREGEMLAVRKYSGLESHFLRRSEWFGSDSQEAHSLFAKSNWNLKYGSERPVDFHVENGASLICDVFGNLWQWCEDLFEPLEGFKPHPLYPDYSQPSFDRRHHLLMGGSFATTGSGTAPWTRNNFRSHFFQHAGFRLIRSRHA